MIEQTAFKTQKELAVSCLDMSPEDFLLESSECEYEELTVRPRQT